MTDTTHTPRLLWILAAATLVTSLHLICAAPARAQAPTITMETTEGQAASGTWLGGSPPFNAYATAPSGIRSMTVSVDGNVVTSQPFPCDYGYPVPPCHNHGVSFFLPTTRYSDGRHTLTTEAVEAFGAAATASVPLLVDNTPPAPPGDVVVEGGIGWRAQPAWRIAWTNPKQQFAPITAVRYRLCPADADSGDPRVAALAKAECLSGEFAGRELTRLPEPFQVPKPGLWTLRVWLVDAAGNSNEDAAVVVAGLGYDPTPPQVGGFAAQDPNDPARVTVGASDDGAPLTGGAIELQRVGSRTWRPLTTDVSGGGISALVDDETLRKGRYRMRATVINAAGLQHGTDRGADGSAKTVRLPIRLGSRLQAGRRVGKVCRGRGAKRRCRYKLRRRVPVELGRRITLRARLTANGTPIKQQPLEVWQRLSVAGAAWQPIGTVQTNTRGRVRYKTPKGPARQLRFRYPGTPLMRGDNATIALRVQAKSSLTVSRRSVINGEYVMFSGRLKGQPVPAAGVLVELQVRSRGKWRTFAQPRANATGAWKYQYRFETVSGGARFRFRARVRRQTGYPYATGSSRVLGVRVHGL
jgi:5-hydroxyisourate hydrolase-like protein (transthyretin family)